MRLKMELLVSNCVLKWILIFNKNLFYYTENQMRGEVIIITASILVPA